MITNCVKQYQYLFCIGMGVKGSAMVNSILTLINMAIMILVILVGFYYADLRNWTVEGNF